ncbi:MAG: hypothetical protein HQM14_07820 [SAR324 cluster bacterium]|nr:hypothetical protein [SAR324 cluster bacterium]
MKKKQIFQSLMTATTGLFIISCAAGEVSEDGASSEPLSTSDYLASEDQLMREASSGILEATGDSKENQFETLDINSDSVVSFDEFIEVHMAKHTELDTNDDGVVSMEEISNMEQEKRKEHFTALDTNEDGVLSSDELPVREQKGLTNLDVDGDGNISVDEWNSVKNSVEGFEKLDANEDGFVDEDELAVLKEERGEKQGKGHPGGRPQREVTNLDVDGDEVISQEEFLATDTRLEEHFGILDTNSDGMLDSDEMSAAFIRKFEHLDANGDGELTQDEFSDDKNKNEKR